MTKIFIVRNECTTLSGFELTANKVKLWKFFSVTAGADPLTVKYNMPAR
jgi:hypothetical protein